MEWSTVKQMYGEMEDDEENSETEPESGVESTEKPKGFGGRIEKPVRKVSGCSSEDSESPADDFTDAADVELRGFIPSCGPSPAFGPRHTSGPGSVQFSPFEMPVPMEVSVGEELGMEDIFSMPGPAVPEEDSQGHSFLSSMLNNAAYNSTSHGRRPRHSSD